MIFVNKINTKIDDTLKQRSLVTLVKKGFERRTFFQDFDIQISTEASQKPRIVLVQKETEIDWNQNVEFVQFQLNCLFGHIMFVVL
jgi:hypothetical protein